MWTTRAGDCGNGASLPDQEEPPGLDRSAEILAWIFVVWFVGIIAFVLGFLAAKMEVNKELKTLALTTLLILMTACGARVSTLQHGSSPEIGRVPGWIRCGAERLRTRRREVSGLR